MTELSKNKVKNREKVETRFEILSRVINCFSREPAFDIEMSFGSINMRYFDKFRDVDLNSNEK